MRRGGTVCNPVSGKPVAVVIKRGIRARSLVVWHCFARLRELRRHVTWIGGSLIVLKVAGSRRPMLFEVVVVVDVAVGAGAGRNRVQAGERETGAVVIERGIKPGAGGVALVAGLREIRRHVVGIGGSLVVLQVAGRAGRAVQVVVVIDVAVGAGAGRDRVQSGEREPGAVVIKRGIKPGAGGVALVRRSAGNSPSRGWDWWFPGSPSGGRSRRPCCSGCSCY